MSEELSRSFGYRRVSSDERAQLVRQVFRDVATRYDLMNDFMSFGIHRLWKRSFVKQAAVAAGERVMDLAGGTGDVARALAAGGGGVMVVDASAEMMLAGRRHGALPCVVGLGEALPVADASLDLVTIAFGIRNVTRMDEALREALRVLRPGGRFLCLEFSRPHPLIRPFYDLYSRWVIPRLGSWVAGQRSAYVYLVESIRRFPDQEEMKRLMEQAGFDRVAYRNLSFGIACVHSGVRPAS